MNIKQSLLAIICAAASFTVSATEVELATPGSLKNALTGQDDITSLKIKGQMDAADFDYINNTLVDVTTLDLSEAVIAGYDGAPTLYHRTKFEANTLPAYALAGTKIESITLPTGLVAIGEGALSSTPLRAVTFPATLTSIGEGAFSNCANLTQVSIPATVTSVGNHAFSRCANLTSVTWSAACDIPAQGFLNCVVLNEFSIEGNGTKSIGEQAFYNCTSLKNFNFPASLTSVGVAAFKASGLEKADMADAPGLTTIGDRAFANCASLTEVKFSPATTSMGEGIFFDDTALRTVALPAGIKELPAYTYKGDTSVDTTYLVHPGVESIGDFSLKGLTQVTTFAMPQALEYIGDEAMSGWDNLTTLNAHGLSEPPALGNDVWKGADKENVHLLVDNGMASKFEAADQWKDFKIDVMTGIEDVTADQPATEVKAWFEGKTIHVRAAKEIDRVTVMDIQGRQYLSVWPADYEITIDTADFTEHIYLINLTLDGAETVTVKIAR